MPTDPQGPETLAARLASWLEVKEVLDNVCAIEHEVTQHDDQPWARDVSRELRNAARRLKKVVAALTPEPVTPACSPLGHFYRQGEASCVCGNAFRVIYAPAPAEPVTPPPSAPAVERREKYISDLRASTAALVERNTPAGEPILSAREADARGLAVDMEIAMLRDELATCCLCEYEFDEPHTVNDRGRQVVCAKCWPHDADARGWQQRAEKAEQERDALRTALKKLKPFMLEGVTAGANPQKGGGMSPPLWHMVCRACDKRWTVKQWKEPLDSHPESDCWFAQALVEARR